MPIAVRRLPAQDGPITAVSPVLVNATRHFCIPSCRGPCGDAPSDKQNRPHSVSRPIHYGWHRIGLYPTPTNFNRDLWRVADRRPSIACSRRPNNRRFDHSGERNASFCFRICRGPLRNAPRDR